MNNPQSFNELANEVVSLGLISHKRIGFLIKKTLIDDVLNQTPKLSDGLERTSPKYTPDDYQTAVFLVHAQLDIMLDNYKKKHNIDT